MNRKNYIAKLNRAAASGPKALIEALRSRLIDGDGPILDEHDDSLLDVIQMAHAQSGEDEKKTYTRAFLEILKEIRDAWEEASWENMGGGNISRQQATLLSFSMMFFQGIELDDAPKRRVISFIASLADFEDDFRKWVPTPVNGAVADVYGLMERIRLKHLEKKDNFRDILAQMWATSIKDGVDAFAKNSMLLKKMAQAQVEPEVLAASLRQFFQQTASLSEKKRTAALQNTFMGVGDFIDDDEYLDALFPAIEDQIERTLKSENFLASKNEINYFLDSSGLFLAEDEKRHERFYHDMKHRIDEMEKNQEQRKPSRRVVRTDHSKELELIIKKILDAESSARRDQPTPRVWALKVAGAWLKEVRFRILTLAIHWAGRPKH